MTDCREVMKRNCRNKWQGFFANWFITPVVFFWAYEERLWEAHNLAIKDNRRSLKDDFLFRFVSMQLEINFLHCFQVVQISNRVRVFSYIIANYFIYRNPFLVIAQPDQSTSICVTTARKRPNFIFKRSGKVRGTKPKNYIFKKKNW